MIIPPISPRVLAIVGVIALAGVAAWALRGDGLAPGGTRATSPSAGAAKSGPAKSQPATPGAAKNGPPGGVPVEIARAEMGPLAGIVRAVGTLRSDESVIVRSEIAGRIVATPFAEGQVVDKGAVLFQIDDDIARAELVEADAAAKLSRQNEIRARELLAKGAGTVRARDEAFARMEMDRARVELARARLSKTRIVAPFTGIVGLRKVSAGDYVAPGQDLINLESIDTIKLDFRIPERHLGALAVGQKVVAEIDAFPGRPFEGQVYAIDPQIDPAGRSIAIRATLPNTARALRPGLFARVTLTVQERTQAVTVPEQAIMPRGENFFVFKVQDGKAVLAPVEIGRRAAGRVEIVKGVAAGEEVVAAGQIKVQNGTPVRAAVPPAPSTPSVKPTEPTKPGS